MEKPNQRKSIILKTKKNCSNREQFYILLVRLSEKNSAFRRFP